MRDPRHAAGNLLGTRTISLDLLWLRYWAQGGTAGVLEFDAYIHGALQPEQFELKLIDWALEEALPRRIRGLDPGPDTLGVFAVGLLALRRLSVRKSAVRDMSAVLPYPSPYFGVTGLWNLPLGARVVISTRTLACNEAGLVILCQDQSQGLVVLGIDCEHNP